MRYFIVLCILCICGVFLAMSINSASKDNDPAPASTFRYILRYYIDPEFNAEERIAELAEFCKTSDIEEVMLFDNPEELFIAYPDSARIDQWFAHAKKVRKVLNDNGIVMSVNPWVTLGHASRGRRFRDDQRDWVRMIGEMGQTAYATPCPLDPNWQAMLCDYFARIARELDPTAIYVEDDFRLHNHEGMGFGGCFCRLHLERFARLVGSESVTREQLFEKILAPGEPHPWRSLWLDLSRYSILEPAARLQSAVHAANPKVKLALMTSFPDVHSAEGRDWVRLRNTLEPDTRAPFIFRPHMPPYTEQPAIVTLPVPTRHTISNLPRPLSIYPELENSPRCGRYSKSGAYSAWECLQAAVIGSAGITINHYDMMGNGIPLDPDFGTVLKKIKPRLSAIRALNIDDDNAQGIELLYSPEVARHMNSKSPQRFNGIVANSMVWATPLQTFGFSTRMVQQPSRKFPYAVSDETLRALSDQEITGLLAGSLFLDVNSAKILIERGFGDLIGIRAVETAARPAHAFEMIPYGDNRYKATAPKIPIDLPKNFPKMILDTGAVPMTWICRADSSYIAPGMVFFENNLKGKVITALSPSGDAYYHPLRRQLFRNAFRRLAPRAHIASVLNAPLHAYRVVTDSGVLLALLNPTTDPVKDPLVYAFGGYADSALMLDIDGRWKPAPMSTGGFGELLTFETVIPPLDGLFILINK